MDHVIAKAGLRLRYLCDPSSIRALDSQKILDDLSEPETRYTLSTWFARVSLTDFDHIALAIDIKTDCHVAMLVANDGDAPSGPYLDLRAAMVVEAIRGSMVMRRMLAYTMLRMYSLGVMPRVIAAQTSIPVCYRLLSLFSQHFSGATIFPRPEAGVIDFGSAALARQIVRHAGSRYEYECGTGAVIGAKLTNATCFARTARADPIVNAMFERSLGSSDQMMVVLDMRGCDEKASIGQMTDLVRSRWKLPVPAMRRMAASTALGSIPRKPTLSA